LSVGGGWVWGEPAPPRPPARRKERAEVPPSRQVVLAEDAGAPRAKPGRDRRSRHRRRPRQREGSRGGLHRVAGVDVVLEEDGDAVERAAHDPLPALGVGLMGEVEGVGIELEDAVEAGTLLVELLDPLEIELRQPDRADMP